MWQRKEREVENSEKDKKSGMFPDEVLIPKARAVAQAEPPKGYPHISPELLGPDGRPLYSVIEDGDDFGDGG